MELYRETASFVADSFSGSKNWTTFLFYSPKERKKEVFEWLGDKETLFFAQGTGSLGQRMSRAFEKCFSLGIQKCRHHRHRLRDDNRRRSWRPRFRLLSEGEFEAVLGPATDGGYYLLGLCRKTDAVFQDMRWSTSRVFKETEKRIRRKMAFATPS